MLKEGYCLRHGGFCRCGGTTSPFLTSNVGTISPLTTHSFAQVKPRIDQRAACGSLETACKLSVHGGRPKIQPYSSAVFVVSERSTISWLQIFRGLRGAVRSPFAASSQPGRICDILVELVVALRRQRFSGRRIALEIRPLPVTESRLLGHRGLSRLRAPEAAPFILPFEHARPGDLLHLYIKEFSRFDHAGHANPSRQLQCLATVRAAPKLHTPPRQLRG